MGAALALLAVAFVSFISHLNKMLYGKPPEEVIDAERGRRAGVVALALLLLNVACWSRSV